MRTSAAAVVALVLAWDTAGLRFERDYEDALRRIYCFDPANRCASEEPAWEELAVVDGYQVEPLHEGPDSARFQVIHDEIARVWPGGMEASAGSPPLTITLRRLDGGWRIVAIEPPLTPRLSRRALLRRYSGVAPDSAVLARWLRER
ncbi:MAG TPA: hypothetical protein VK939_11535 [Longimicrobiales bacterium]|nr:hypothetical protein [Longimicrobiales bacterium]